MHKQRIILILLAAVLLAPVISYGQTVVPASKQDELIAVLKSGDATRQEKIAACRLLTFIATKKAVPTLAALLADEEMNHMARYALEPIKDPSVDIALLEALGKLKGKPLVGVIGSLGVRGETRAVKPMAKMLKSNDAMVAQAAARSLGNIGDAAAAKALSSALSGSSGDTKLAICEGCGASIVSQVLLQRIEASLGEVADPLHTALSRYCPSCRLPFAWSAGLHSSQHEGKM